MTGTDKLNAVLPSARQIRQAVRIYIEFAYPAGLPQTQHKLIPPDGPFDPADWLLSGLAEYDEHVEPEELRTISLRLGNRFYPHMKLRLARPPNGERFLFMVDAHDTMLECHARPSDMPAIEELKRGNSQLSQSIVAAWTAAGLPTEQSYLRGKIARSRRSGK